VTRADLRENPYAIPPELVPRHRRDEPGRLLDSTRVRGYLPVEVGRPAEPELVASADGLLSEVLLTVPAYATGDLFWPVYEDLLSKLPAEVRFVILAHRSVADAVSARVDALELTDRTTLLAAPDDVGFSIWAEDGYLFVHGADGERCFVEPFVFRRRGDALVADLVTSGTDLRMYQAPLYFQGGNVLVGDDFFLIGGDYVNETIASGVLSIDPRASREEQMATVTDAYRSYLDHRRRPVVVASRIPVPVEASVPVRVEGARWTDAAYQGNAPGTVQPLFHIDMFLTLAGRAPSGAYRVAVGDPRLAAEILGRPVWRYAMADVYDDIAQQLDEAGFEVVRTPLPLAAAADRAARVREWYFATANNALVEIGSDRRRVWLPSYGHTAWPELAAIDEAHVGIWRDLGFEAELLGDFHPFAQRFGAVHCIKKYLARREG
jgi:hypothetical protein